MIGIEPSLLQEIAIIEKHDGTRRPRQTVKLPINAQCIKCSLWNLTQLLFGEEIVEWLKPTDSVQCWYPAGYEVDEVGSILAKMCDCCLVQGFLERNVLPDEIDARVLFLKLLLHLFNDRSRETVSSKPTRID